MSFISSTAADQNTYDVIVVGSGAAGGQTAYTLAMEGARVLMLEAGRRYEPATETPMMQTSAEAPLRGASTPDKALRLLGRDHRRRLGGSGRALHQRLGRSRAPVPLVARQDVRRPHQPLGPYLAAQRTVRFQAACARRSRLRLADGLRGSRALLRQGRDAHRRLRRRRRPGKHAPLLGRCPAAAAQAARQRPAGETARREGRRAGDPDASRGA